MRKLIKPSDTTVESGKVVVEAIVLLMKNKTLWQNTTTTLLKILTNKVPIDDLHKLPKTANHLSRIIQLNVNELLNRGVVASKAHSGERSIRLSTVPADVISTKITKEETTTMRKPTLKEDVLGALIELGPITSNDIATLLDVSLYSVSSLLSALRREGYNITTSKNGDGTRSQLYNIDTVKKEETPVPKVPLTITKTKPIILTPPTAPTVKSTDQVSNALVDRAYYLMLALCRLNIDDIMDTFSLDESVAQQVLLKVMVKYDNKLHADITLRPAKN